METGSDSWLCWLFGGAYCIDIPQPTVPPVDVEPGTTPTTAPAVVPPEENGKTPGWVWVVVGVVGIVLVIWAISLAKK